MSDSTRRYIRLKEWGLSQEVTLNASADYVARTDGSIEIGAYNFALDSNGFMHSARPEDKTESPIVIMGDSVVESLYVSNEDRLYRSAERRLNDLGVSSKVLGGGVTGATSLHSLHVITTKIIPLKPTFTVLLNGAMDVECATDPRSYWSQQEYIDPFAYVDRTEHSSATATPTQFEDRKRILRSIVYIMRQYDLPIALATFAFRSWSKTDDFLATRYSEEAYLQLEAKYALANQATRDVSKELGVALFDVGKNYAGRSDLLYDNYHLNKKGNVEIGMWLGEQLAYHRRGKHLTVVQKVAKYFRGFQG